MILLDTNVLCEPWKPRPDNLVLGWFNRCARSSLFLPAVVLAEIRRGIEVMPEGKRRADLEDRYDLVVGSFSSEAILHFDRTCVMPFAQTYARRCAKGLHNHDADLIIAAIALANNLSLATRNTADFEGLGLALINPFEPQSA